MGSQLDRGWRQGTTMAKVTHPGRPKDEDPHVKCTTKNKKEVIEYIVPDDLLEELGIDEMTYDELKALFELFDLDRDGVLCYAEFEKVLRALGRSPFPENARRLACQYGVDQTECSVSFVEFLKLNGRTNAPSPTEIMLEIFDMFDFTKNGTIPEPVMRKILSRKFAQEADTIEEMLGEYRARHAKSDPETPEEEQYIDYRKFVAMLEE